MDWDFIANAAVDVLDIVPEPYRGYYEEDKAAGKFIVRPEIKPLAEAYTGANKKYQAATKTRTEDNKKDATRRAVLDQVSAVLGEVGWEVGEDLTKLPEVVKTKITELLDTVKGGKEHKLNLDTIKKEMEKRVLDVTTKKDGEVQKMRGTLEKYMIDAAAASELSAAGTVEGGTELIMPQLRKFVKVVPDEAGENYEVRVVDTDGTIRLNNKAEPMSIKDLVTEMKQKFPMAFRSEQKPGGGKAPGSGKLPAGQQFQHKGEEKSATQKIAAGLAAMGK
jgi:hypothetical protein